MEILLGEVNQGQSRVGRAFIILEGRGDICIYIVAPTGSHLVTQGGCLPSVRVTMIQKQLLSVDTKFSFESPCPHSAPLVISIHTCETS